MYLLSNRFIAGTVQMTDMHAIVAVGVILCRLGFHLATTARLPYRITRSIVSASMLRMSSIFRHSIVVHADPPTKKHNVACQWNTAEVRLANKVTRSIYVIIGKPMHFLFIQFVVFDKRLVSATIYYS